MSDIEFTDPPPKRDGRSKPREIAEALRARPGKWALIEHGAAHASLVTRIRRGKGPFAPEGSFDATSRVDHSGEFEEYDIYARYLGDTPGQAAD